MSSFDGYVGQEGARQPRPFSRAGRAIALGGERGRWWQRDAQIPSPPHPPVHHWAKEAGQAACPHGPHPLKSSYVQCWRETIMRAGHLPGVAAHQEKWGKLSTGFQSLPLLRLGIEKCLVCLPGHAETQASVPAGKQVSMRAVPLCSLGSLACQGNWRARGQPRPCLGESTSGHTPPSNPLSQKPGASGIGARNGQCTQEVTPMLLPCQWASPRITS